MNPQKYRRRFTRLSAWMMPAMRYGIVNSGRPFRRAPWGRILPAFLLTLFLAPAEMTRAQSVSPGTIFTNYVQKINGSTVIFEMVAIPGGSILVGSPPNELGRDTNDLPCRKVVIKPFWIGRYEVSWQEYLPFVFYDRSDIIREGNKLEGKIDRDGISHPTAPYGSVYRERGEKGYPAIGMGLPAAYEYCRWLTRRTGIRYRLPTEEEWEYACRAGSTNAYFWGNAAALAKDYGWYAENSSETTQPIGKLKPNPFGVFDIVGNVAEWCFDPRQPAAFVARGGAFSEPVTQLRCAGRLIETPLWNELDPQFPQSIWWLASADWVGFRIARSLDETQDGYAPLNEMFPPETTKKATGQNALANYRRLCAICHGTNGKGDTATGRRHQARNYSDPQVKLVLQDASMFKAIKVGLIANGVNVMSPFVDLLSESDIKALVDYMRKF